MSSTQHVVFEFEEARFKELIVLISELCAKDPTYGSVKLNKILYFADFMAYRVLGKPITGATYFKLQEGPAPREPGWMLAEDREDIPYETAWLSQDPVDQTDEALALQMADSYHE